MRRRYVFLTVLVFMIFFVPMIHAVAENVQDASYWRNEGDKYMQKQEYDRAADCYKKALATDPLHARSIFRIAFVYDIQRKFTESETYLDRALELVKSGKDHSKLPIGDIYAEKGYILVQQGRYKEALPFYDLAIESDPKWAYPVFWKAVSYFKLNNFKTALELCNKVLQMEPGHKDAQKLKGMIESQQQVPAPPPGK